MYRKKACTSVVILCTTRQHCRVITVMDEIPVMEFLFDLTMTEIRDYLTINPMTVIF